MYCSIATDGSHEPRCPNSASKLEITTIGNPIPRRKDICLHCSYTGGCPKCNPINFIGSLSDEEADEMKAELKSFKKKFNDDFDKKFKRLYAQI